MAGCCDDQHLMGWTGGYVLLALCFTLPPNLKFTVLTSSGIVIINKAQWYDLCYLSFTYVAGHALWNRFLRYLEVPIEWGVASGCVFFASLEMRLRIPVAQYCLIFSLWFSDIRFADDRISPSIRPRKYSF
jgi:hypothetical protein